MDAIERVGGKESVRKLIACVKEHPEIWMSSKEELSKGVLTESFLQVLNALGLEGQVSVTMARSAWLELVARSERADVNNDPFFNDMTWLQTAHRTNMAGCAVAWCTNNQDSVLFDVPPKDSLLWQQWCDAVPSLLRVSNAPLKVCALHFHNGAPDETCPVPVLRLSNSRKRKTSDGTETASFDRALQAVTDSAFEREMHLMGETDAQQPLKLPSCSTASPRVLRLSVQDGSAESKTLRDKGTKVFKLVQSADNEPKQTEKPVKNTTSQPVTLMSVLEQCLQSKETEPIMDKVEQPSMSGACDKCVHDLPALRRSMGRLEARVDSMIAIVRTLCARQSSEHNKRQTAILGKPKPVSTKPLITQGGMATLIRVKSGNGSTFKLLRTSPRTVKPSRDGSPPSLSTKFTRAPKQPDTSLTYLHKAVIRSLLLFQGSHFSIASFRAEGPAVVRTVAEDKLRECLSKLVNDGLLRPMDEHLELTHPEASFRKERNALCLSKLTEYGISKQHYHASMQIS